jgi:hypothetical protein
MVHALCEFRRVFRPDGVLLDLRPVADRWPVQVVAGQDVWEAGRVEDLPAQLEDEAASAAALAQVVRSGWFVLERAETFDFHYCWDTPDEMQAYLDTEWEGYVSLSADVVAGARALWVGDERERRVRVPVKMHIGCWRKVSDS